VIVLGGGFSNIVQLYAGLSALSGIYTFSDGIDTPIVSAAHGDSSGARGAAWHHHAEPPNIPNDGDARAKLRDHPGAVTGASTRPNQT
jgi:hypothetical protein